MPGSKTRSKSRSKSKSKTRRSKSRSKSKSKSLSKDIKFALKQDQTKTHIFFNNALLRGDEFLESTKLILEENEEHEVYPKESSRVNNEYRSICNLINMKIDNSESLCKDINPDYIKNSMQTSHAIIAIGSDGMNILPNGNIFAFALMELDENRNSMYLDIICSNNGIKGAGQILMNEIDRIAKTIYITKITLSSVSRAIGFYEKFGFIKVRKCEKKNELCEMVKKISYRK